MKNFLKYCPVMAFLATLLGFFLLLFTNLMHYDPTNVDFQGYRLIFGWSKPYQGFAASTKVSWTLVLAFILIVISFITIGIEILYSFDKLKKLENYIFYIFVGTSIVLVLASVFVFLTKQGFLSANQASSLKKNYHTLSGAIWSGIFFLLAGGFSLLPCILGTEEE